MIKDILLFCGRKPGQEKAPMMKSCPYCGRIHEAGCRCPSKAEARNGYGRRTKDTEERRLRRTYAWTKKSISIRQRDNYLCRFCLEKKHKINNKMLEVHHIVPLKEDKNLWLEDRNLITLCKQCHEDAEAGSIKRDELIRLAACLPGI